MKATFYSAALCCVIFQLVSCVPLASPAASDLAVADNANLTSPGDFNSLVLQKLRGLSQTYENIDVLAVTGRHTHGAFDDPKGYDYITIIAHDPETNVEIHTHNFPNNPDVWTLPWTQPARLKHLVPCLWHQISMTLAEALVAVAIHGFPGPWSRVTLMQPKGLSFVPDGQVYYSFGFPDLSIPYVFLGTNDRKIYRGFATAADAVGASDSVNGTAPTGASDPDGASSASSSSGSSEAPTS